MDKLTQTHPFTFRFFFYFDNRTSLGLPSGNHRPDTSIYRKINGHTNHWKHNIFKWKIFMILYRVNQLLYLSYFYGVFFSSFSSIIHAFIISFHNFIIIFLLVHTDCLKILFFFFFIFYLFSFVTTNDISCQN